MQIVVDASDPAVGCFIRIFKRASLRTDLASERLDVFALAKLPYSSTDETLARVMASLYRRMTGTELVGRTWRVIGFQVCDSCRLPVDRFALLETPVIAM